MILVPYCRKIGLREGGAGLGRAKPQLGLALLMGKSELSRTDPFNILSSQPKISN